MHADGFQAGARTAGEDPLRSAANATEK